LTYFPACDEIILNVEGGTWLPYQFTNLVQPTVVLMFADVLTSDQI